MRPAKVPIRGVWSESTLSVLKILISKDASFFLRTTKIILFLNDDSHFYAILYCICLF